MGFRIIRAFKNASICLLTAFVFFGFFSFARAQSVSSNSGISFGLIEFATMHVGELLLGTNGGVSLTGTGLFYQGDAVPGQITINDTSGIVEIRCETTSVMAEASGAGSLNVSDIEVSVSTGVSAGSGSRCQGVGGGDATAAVINLDSNPNARVIFGGKLNIPSGALTGGKTYSSSVNGGSALTVSIVFQ